MSASDNMRIHSEQVAVEICHFIVGPAAAAPLHCVKLQSKNAGKAEQLIHGWAYKCVSKNLSENARQ